MFAELSETGFKSGARLSFAIVSLIGWLNVNLSPVAMLFSNTNSNVRRSPVQFESLSNLRTRMRTDMQKSWPQLIRSLPSWCCKSVRSYLAGKHKAV